MRRPFCIIMIGALATACTGQGSRASDSARASAPSDVAQTPPADTSRVRSPSALQPESPSSPRRSTPLVSQAPRNAPKPTKAPSSHAPEIVTVQAIIDGESLVDKTVRVAGRCIGDSPILAVGGTPRTRSDWQLAENGRAVYVTGPRPAPCVGAPAQVTVLARVAQDTIHGLGRSAPRRYLVLEKPE